MTQPTQPSPRDELVEAIAGGRGCGGHYNCFATSEDTAEAGRDLDAYRAAVLREAAALLRAAPSDGIGNNWNWWDAATIPDSCADALEDEADRLTERPAEQPPQVCGDIRQFGLLGQPLGPCTLTGEHTQHEDLNGTRWAPRPVADPYAQVRIAWEAVMNSAMRAMEAGTASVRTSLTDVPDTFKGNQS